MDFKIEHFVIFITISSFFSCRDGVSVTKIEGRQIGIESSYKPSDSIENFVSPYRKRIDAVLDSALAYAPLTISKTDGTYNTPAGNLLADIVLSEGGPIFKSRTGESIDFVLLNHGGIRSIIPKGKVTARSAYEVMPFENSIVVAKLSGKSVQKLVLYLRDFGQPHPISGLQVVLNRENGIASVRIQGKPLDDNRSYNVATSDYLLNGGDTMVFFKDAEKTTKIDYKIRNAMIDYFNKVDTIAPVMDDRYYRME
ncbi:5'-nucleotidase C-terminal domain-containing protein [Pricia sp.]|uniref:5'-nucleotidase C-terminal domain-containing protein n=1 Tax=Pricia sp. TaxID=2268138 RepID=UPI0035938887